MTDARTDLDTDERDRKLAQAIRWGLPGATLVGFLVMLLTTSLGPALLVLAAGGLLGAIALLWTSLRSLFGDVPIDEALDEAAAAARGHATSRAAERKRVALRALKDLEHEHAVGKIDDADYLALTERYRADAKAALRELDDQVAEFRPRAEALVEARLSRSARKSAKTEPEKAPRVACAKCGAKNDPDARFCKKCGANLKKKKKAEPSDERPAKIAAPAVAADEETAPEEDAARKPKADEREDDDEDQDDDEDRDDDEDQDDDEDEDQDDDEDEEKEKAS
jgi:ribosomal protein L40E